MPFDLRTLFPLEPGPDSALEHFIGEQLLAARVWASAREMDGIAYIRVLEGEAERLRIAGRMWDLEGAKHAFWLDLERGVGESVAWVLHFEVVAASERRARNAIEIAERAEEIEWRVRLTGRATVVGGRLVAD